MPEIKKRPDDPDRHKGVVEGDQSDSGGHANRTAPGALTADGLPADPVAIAQDRIGANVDDSEVAQAGETGKTAETLRDEEQVLE